MAGVFEHFTHLVADASGWAYAIVFLLAALDAVLPVVPSETAVITAGVVAAGGDLSLPLVIVAAAAGAFAGDNFAYLIGHRFGALAAVGWALYASLLGYFGGRAFEDAAWKGLIVALATGFAVAGLVEFVRW